MRLLITIALIILTTACSKTSDSTAIKSDNKESFDTEDNGATDTLWIYKVKYDSSYDYIFPTTFHPTELSSQEIQACDSLLRQYIVDYNKEAKKRFDEITKKYSGQKFNLLDFTIKLNEYGRQYMAVISDLGEKIVYVNCICDPSQFDTWDRNLIQVHDGGNCFFNFKVNLMTKKLYEFMENGVA